MIDENPKKLQKNNRRRTILWYWFCVALLILLAILFWLFLWRYNAYTDDAYVEGNQVYITPLQPGFVNAIHTDDTYLALKGQLLVELDKTDALISLNQAKEELSRVVREVSQNFHDVFVYKAEIDVKRSEFVKAAQDFQHRAALLEAEGVSLEDYEHSLASLRSSYYSLQKTKTLYQKALSFVQGTSVKSHPLVLAAADKVRNAWIQLYRCNLYSPVEGLVAQRKIQVGMWVNSGEPLMSVIPLDQIWVNANFKETQLKHMRIGQLANITSDLYGKNIVYHGKIVGFPGGAGNAFSLLPPQNLSGNWIKVVQRLPVRIELDPQEIINYPLRVGLSMEVTVDLTGDGIIVPTSSQGSPIYRTTIYEREEKGDEEMISQIVCENIDSTLTQYMDKPLILEIPQNNEKLSPSIEKLIKDPSQFMNQLLSLRMKSPSERRKDDRDTKIVTKHNSGELGEEQSAIDRSYFFLSEGDFVPKVSQLSGLPIYKGGASIR